MGSNMDKPFLCVNGVIGVQGNSASGRIRRNPNRTVAVGTSVADANDMIAPNIVEVKWFTGNGSVGVVLVKTEYAGLKCYIGTGLGVNADYDAEFIARNGAKVPRNIAAAYFPKRIKDGVIYDGKADKATKGRKDPR